MSTCSLKTKAATVVLKVIGHNNTLYEYDFLRHKLEFKKNNRKTSQQNLKKKSMLLFWGHYMKLSSQKQGEASYERFRKNTITNTTRSLFEQRRSTNYYLNSWKEQATFVHSGVLLKLCNTFFQASANYSTGQKRFRYYSSKHQYILPVITYFCVCGYYLCVNWHIRQ